MKKKEFLLNAEEAGDKNYNNNIITNMIMYILLKLNHTRVSGKCGELVRRDLLEEEYCMKIEESTQKKSGN